MGGRSSPAQPVTPTGQRSQSFQERVCWRRTARQVGYADNQSYRRRPVEEQASLTPSAIVRGHNVVHFVPADWTALPPVLGQTLDRVDVQAGSTQALIIVSDAEAAMGVTKALMAATGNVGPRIVAATGSDRTARVLRAGAAPVVVGAPAQLLGLLAASALKLDGLRTVVVAWAEEILAAGGSHDLDTLLTEVPKEAYRVVVSAEVSPAVEDFIERHARRAPRLGVPAATAAGGRPEAGAQTSSPLPAPSSPSSKAVVPAPGLPAAVGYVVSAPAARSTTLRAMLDQIDPPSAAIFVRSDESEREARQTIETLGYRGPDAPVRVFRGPSSEHTALLVLYDLPIDGEEWRAAAGGGPARVIAQISPRQLAHLHRVTLLPAKPVVLGALVAGAHARDEALRAELRLELSNGAPTRELLALEPLLADFDGAALGAAALRLLERERAERASAKAAPASAPLPRQDVPADTRARDQERPRGDRPRGDRPHSAPRGDRPRGGSPAGGRGRPVPPRETRPLPRNPR